MLDLRYEARSIDQHLTSPGKVDEWFEAKTKGMTDLSRAALKKRWGTMQKVVSAEPRARQIVQDIVLDMETRPRLMDGRGNAILVWPAFTGVQVLRAFCEAGSGQVRDRHQLPATTRRHLQGGPGEGATEKLRQYEIYRQMLADHFDEPANTAMGKVEKFEQNVKKLLAMRQGAAVLTVAQLAYC